MDYFDLTHGPPEIKVVMEKVKSPDCGAVVLFVGTARNSFNGQEVVSLYYEAYPKMARKKFEEICEEIRSECKGIKHIAVQHRLGEVPISEDIVAVAISSPHRAESLSAMTLFLDKLKEGLPIWKKENYKNSGSVWKENDECIRAERVVSTS